MVQPVQRTAVSVVSLPRVFMAFAAILFVVAALLAGGVFTGINPWAFGFGAFASVCIAWAFSVWPV
jgi:hypothetical protein